METTLETTRLLLRPMKLDDVDALLHIFSDPKVMASFGEQPFDRERMLGWVNHNLEHQAEHGYGLFSIILKSSDVLIGDCGLEVMQVEGERVAELGYDFRRDYWNQGYATEAAGAVRDFAFQTLQLPKLISLIRVGNQASRRVAEKVGMHCQSEFTRYGNRYWSYELDKKHKYSMSLMEPIPSALLQYLSLRIQAMTDAMVKGNPQSVAHVYADDALLTDLKDFRVEGRTAIDQHWQNLPRYQTWQLHVLESSGDPETPRQRLHSLAHMEIKGQAYVDEGYCFVVWKKQDDGEYRIYVDIYHPFRFEQV